MAKDPRPPETTPTITRDANESFSIRKGLEVSNNVAPVLANPADAMPAGMPASETPQAAAPASTPVASDEG